MIIFPEAFVPAYPRGFPFGVVLGNRSAEGWAAWKRYWDNTIEIAGPEVAALWKAAKEAGAYAAIRVTERDGENSRGTLYCSLLYFRPDG